MQKKRSTLNHNGLSATQHDALRLLASGCTAKYTALVLKLDYATLKKWIKQDTQFQGELNRQLDKQRAQPPRQTSKSGSSERPTDRVKGAKTIT